MLRAVSDKEFLHTNLNNKGVYVDYGATEDIPEDACSFKAVQYYGSRFDSTELK